MSAQNDLSMIYFRFRSHELYLELAKGAKMVPKGVNSPSLRVQLAPRLEGAGVHDIFLTFWDNWQIPCPPIFFPGSICFRRGNKVSETFQYLWVALNSLEWIVNSHPQGGMFNLRNLTRFRPLQEADWPNVHRCYNEQPYGHPRTKPPIIP